MQPCGTVACMAARCIERMVEVKLFLQLAQVALWRGPIHGIQLGLHRNSSTASKVDQ